MPPEWPGIKARLNRGQLLAGSFIKSPFGCAIEILAGAGYDFVVLDEEHAPFDRLSIDHGIVAARAAGIAALVRVASGVPKNLLSVLDCGADGVLVPHVARARDARNIVSACRYRGGSRGFSNSPRAGGFGRLSLSEHVASNDARVAVVAQIEDPVALQEVDEIAAVPGVDALFIGRADLAVAMNLSTVDAGEVHEASHRICAAARAAGKPAMAFVTSDDDARVMLSLGVTALIISSDQGLLRMAASRALDQVRSLVAQNPTEQERGALSLTEEKTR
jgi:staphyloferrin B biosynthesis citrate synthase